MFMNSRVALVAQAAMAAALSALRLQTQRFQGHGHTSFKKRKPYRGHARGSERVGPHPSIRSLMRAARKGRASLMTPDKRALERHAWYRREQAAAALQAAA